MSKKIFALVDCNNFYVSCERLFNPALKNRPVVVLSNNDGCVISRSDEAKKLGIKMGEPLFKIENKIKLYGVKIFSTNFPLYGDISKRVMNILEMFSPKIEIYSIDEAFLELTGINTNIDNHIKKIKETVERETGIPVSVGVGETKTLAKAATYIAKKYKKFNGTFNLYQYPAKEKVLKNIPIEEVWGIGRGYHSKLKLFGINNAYDFSQLSDTFLKKVFSINGLKTARELRGISEIPLGENIIRKSVITSRSFKTPLETLDELRAAFSYFATLTGEKLRKLSMETSFIKIFIKTNRFDRENYLYREAITKTEYPLNGTYQLIKITNSLLNGIFIKGYKYKKAGIMVTDLNSTNNKQLNLFDRTINNKNSKLTESLDKINGRFGSFTVHYGDMELSGLYKPQQKLKSGSYTTKWEELAKVK